MTESKELLIRGGTIVDGTGSPAYRGDLRIRGAQIAEIAPSLDPEPGERVVDATGCTVAPGFIESHTHLDGVMWWQPDLAPLPGNGVTSVIGGNCGFALAPAHEDPRIRDEVIKIFSFFEDFPEGPFRSHLPWDWRTWSEYRRSMEEKVRTPLHFGAFVGHIALRLAAMGLEAWERPAKPDEIARMAELLEDALAAGAMGLSTNLMDHDGQDRPVPSLHADDAEFEALFEVLARHPGTTLQVVVDSLMRMTAQQSTERLARLSEGLPIRMQWAGVPTLQWQRDFGLQAPLAELHERFGADGRDIWTGFMHVPITTVLSIEHSLLFAQSNDYVWHEVVTAETEEAKLALLSDPDWRARARHSWDHEANPISPFPKPQGAVLDNSENEVGPIGVTLGAFAEELGVHCSDALAEWFVRNGVASTVTMPPWEKDEEMVVQLMRDPRSVGNISDAGAHGQMFCGIGYNLMLFSHYVREGLITLEEAVHVQTGKLADHFGLVDRGELAVGKYADLTVFSLEEVEMRPQRKTYDVPDGEGGTTWRWTRDPGPVRLTIAGGEVTFDHGEFTEARPGEILRPGSAA